MLLIAVFQLEQPIGKMFLFFQGNFTFLDCFHFSR